jgi:hypothetical protein
MRPIEYGENEGWGKDQKAPQHMSMMEKPKSSSPDPRPHVKPVFWQLD